MLIHIGLPKCGSTLLQREIFPRLEGCSYIGKRYDEVPWAEEANQRLFEISSLEEARFRTKLGPIQEWAGQKAANRHPIPLISDEWLGLGSSFQRAFPQDRQVVANRLAQLFPGAQILIVVREQLAWLRSFFFEIQRNPFNHFGRDLTVLLRIEREFIEKRGAGYFLPAGEFDVTVDIYRHHFGPSSVKIMLFEELVRQPDTFIREVRQFLDLPTEVTSIGKLPKANSRTRRGEVVLRSAGRTMPMLRRALPRWAKRWLLEIGRLKSTGITDHHYSDEERAWLEAYYREGNRRLDRMIPQDLGSEGYPL